MLIIKLTIMKTKLTQLLLMLFSAFTFLANAQDYDILPVEGRNNLFNEYLLSEFDSVIVKRKEIVKDALLSKEMCWSISRSYMRIM